MIVSLHIPVCQFPLDLSVIPLLFQEFVLIERAGSPQFGGLPVGECLSPDQPRVPGSQVTKPGT